MINPSTIDLKALPWLPLEEKTAFPSRPAIYFAIDSLGAVQYIRRTKNVRTRWGKHHKYSVLSAIADIKVAYLFIDMPELLPDIERALIEYFDPPLNVLRHEEPTESQIKTTERRKAVTYRIDKRLTALLEQSARQNNTSINRELENVLLEHYKARGLIEIEFTPLGEMRGGDRRSKEARGEA